MSTFRDSELDAYDKEEERILADLYFKRIERAKAIMTSVWKMGFFGGIYVYCLISSIIGIIASSAITSPRNAASSNAAVIGLMLIQSVSTVSSVILLRSILSNHAICEAYTEYNILDQMRRFEDPSPAVSLYFSDHLSKPKSRKTLTNAEFWDRMNVYYYYAYFAGYGIVLTIIWLEFFSNTKRLSNLTGIIAPWGGLTLVSLRLNHFIFSILKDGLEYHKRELFKSSVFSNPAWEELIKKLSSQSRFRQKTRDQQSVVETNHTKANHDISDIELTEFTENPISRKYKHDHSDIESASTIGDRSISTASHTRAFSTLVESTANAIQKTRNAIDLSLDNVKNVSHVAVKKRIELRNSVYRILQIESEKLDILQFRRDIYILQHTFHVYNNVLGLPFSINAVISLVMLVYVLFITFTKANFGGNGSAVIFEYVFIVSTYTIYQNITLILTTNSIGPSVVAFCNPLQLVCPDEKLGELSSLQAVLSQLRLSINVFGVVITKEYCFSLLASLILSVSGQISHVISSIEDNSRR